MDYNLDRFIKAQERDFEKALLEVNKGKKVSHWMWYIFPQIKGLGSSSISQYYAISSLEEAKAYWENDYLRINLVTITEVLLNSKKNALDIFGYTDTMKLKSCMTLFRIATGEKLFEEVLEKFFDGEIDEKTVFLTY